LLVARMIGEKLAKAGLFVVAAVGLNQPVVGG
jgi:hypothetical protein